MRRTFVDDELERQLEDSGMVKLSLFSVDEIEYLRDLYETEAPPGSSIGFRTNIYSDDVEKGHALSKAALEFVSQKLLQKLDNYRLALAKFLIKNPGDKGALAAHADPTLVDEAIYRSIVIWMPLEDVDEENGCMWVLPRTHRESPPWRCAIDDLFQVAERVVASTRQASLSVPMKAGQVLLFHPGMVHGSGANSSGVVRLALQLYALPKEADMIQCRLNAEGKIERYRVKDDYMLDARTREFEEGGDFIDVIDRDGVSRLSYLKRVKGVLSKIRA